MYKVWVVDGLALDAAHVGSFDTLEEAEAFVRTIGWTPFNEDNAYEKGVTTDAS